MALLQHRFTTRVNDGEFALRLGEIKEDLVKEVHSGWGDLLVDLYTARYGNPVVADESQLIRTTDWFVLQHRLPDGRTPVQVYADEAPDLNEEERATLRGWDRCIDSMFDIVTRSNQRLELLDLSSGARLTARANIRLPDHHFQTGQTFLSRLVPVRDFHLLSGVQSVILPEQRNLLLKKMKQRGALPTNLGTPTAGSYRPTILLPRRGERRQPRAAVVVFERHDEDGELIAICQRERSH